jgi:hypothetical protein
LTAFKLGPLFDRGYASKIGLDPIQQLSTTLLMRHLAAPEADGNLGLVALAQESRQIPDFDLVVTCIGARAEFHFFDLDLFLFLAGLLRLLTLFKLEFAVIHHPAYGWIGVGYDFYQVKLSFFCDSLRLIYGHHPEVGSVHIDEAYPRIVDLLIQTIVFTSANALPSRAETAAVRNFIDELPTQGQRLHGA